MHTLRRELPIPLYHQLRTILQQGIEVGHWKPEEQLPAEHDLARQFGVSKITVRQALRELATLGYVRREQGRGTFVSRNKLQQGPRELTSFTEEMRRHGVPSSSRVLDQSVIHASGDLAAILKIEEGEKVFRLKRLRLAEGEPMGIQCAHIPLALAPGLIHEDFANASLYEVLQTRYGRSPASARETHFAVLIPAEDAALLGVDAGSPGLAAERISLLASRRPLEFVSSIMRGDRYRIVLDLVAESHGDPRAQQRFSTAEGV